MDLGTKVEQAIDVQVTKWLMKDNPKLYQGKRLNKMYTYTYANGAPVIVIVVSS